MAEYTIDCAAFQNRDEFYGALSDTLSFPDWFGSNLDAVVDCLTDISADTTLRLTGWEPFADTVGFFAFGCRRALAYADRKNPNLHIIVED